MEAAIVSLDHSKAFDRVSHEYLIATIKAFGFGNSFISWLRLLYNDASSCVLVNGFLSPSLNIKRSMRQGCPISALLYVLCMEPVAAGIRNDDRVKGLKIPGTASEVKLSLYADDTNAIVTTMETTTCPDFPISLTSSFYRFELCIVVAAV